MKIIFLWLSLCGLAGAAEVAWLKVEVQQTYVDKDVGCQGLDGEIFLTLEIEKCKISFAQLQNHPLIWVFKPIYRNLPLTRGEIDSIELYTDPQGRSWPKEMKITEATLRWLIFHGAGTSYCPITQSIAKVVPEGKVLNFENEGVLEGIYVSRSPRFDIGGVRKDGAPFEGNLRLVLREYQP